MLTQHLCLFKQGLRSCIHIATNELLGNGRASLPVLTAICSTPQKCTSATMELSTASGAASSPQQHYATLPSQYANTRQLLTVPTPLQGGIALQAHTSTLTALQERLFSSMSASSSSQHDESVTMFASTLDGPEEPDLPAQRNPAARRVPNFYVGLDNLRDNPGARKDVSVAQQSCSDSHPQASRQGPVQRSGSGSDTSPPQSE